MKPQGVGILKIRELGGGNKVICKVTLSFTPIPSALLSPLDPSFSGVCKIRKFYYISAFNAQGSRVIIVVVQVGPVKIYVAAVETLRKKERRDESQFTTKIGGRTSLGLIYFVL